MTRPAGPSPRRRGAPALGPLVVAAVLACGPVAGCADDGDEYTTSAATGTVVARWDIGDTAGGLEIDAGSYRLAIGDDGWVTYRQVAGSAEGDGADPDDGGPDGGGEVHEGRFHLVRDGQRVDVASVDDAKLGLDHVTLEVTFADGTTGRIELGALDGDVVAVRITADDPLGVTERGLDLPPELVTFL